jgi:tetratricopeptide (TPR) repeat protein
MKRPLSLAILGLVVGAGLGAVILMPGDLERVTMLERDGEIEAAARLANALYDRGDRRNALLGRVFELNHAVGDAARADRALREYLAGSPNSARTLRKAAEFFELEQDLDGAISAWNQLLKLVPTAAVVDKLARLYRLHGRFDDERQLLQAHRTRLDGELLTRLGGLLGQKGEVLEAIAALRIADDTQPDQFEHYGGLLFDLLMRAGAAGEAARRAQRWASQSSDIYARIPMVLRLAEDGHSAQAIALAGIANAGAGISGDQARHAAVWALMERGYLGLAGDLLETLSDASVTRATRSAIAGYIERAVAEGRYGDVLARSLRLVTAATDHQQRNGLLIASALFDRWGLPGLGPLRAYLTPERAMLEPLFAAKVALAERQPGLASSYLSEVALAEDDEDLALAWMAMAERAFTPSALARELVRRSGEQTLPTALIRPMQASLREAGIMMPGLNPFANRATSGAAPAQRPIR